MIVYGDWIVFRRAISLIFWLESKVCAYGNFGKILSALRF